MGRPYSAPHISDGPSQLVIMCSRCGRRGVYSRDRAIAKLGDMPLPDFLRRVVDEVCARNRDVTNFGGCMARYAPESQLERY